MTDTSPRGRRELDRIANIETEIGAVLDAPASRRAPVDTRYVAVSTGPRNQIVGLGRTVAEAEGAVFRAWRRLRRPVDGVPIATVDAFRDYFGIGVFGPLHDGEGDSF